jgi:hypothetical protein
MVANDRDMVVIEAIGKASEALEYVERARGHLYEFHQLMGRADFEFGDSADKLKAAGLDTAADRMTTILVGRNVIDGRWTFQIIDEFNDLYYSVAQAVVQELENEHLDGERHAFERRLKLRRRTPGQPGHEMEPSSVAKP